MGVTAFFLLISFGLAITVQAQDCSRPLAGQNMNVRGEDILKDTFPDGSRVAFACNVGYTAAGGSPSVTCTAGVWSPVRLRCERKNCGSAGEITNGDIDYIGTEFGDKATISCRPGYILVGNRELTCGDQGWLGRLPECEVVTCQPPGGIASGSFSPIKEVYNYQDVVGYSCQRDFTLSGSRELTCSADGRFNRPVPKCVLVECRDITEIPNGNFKEGSRPPHRYQATIIFQCFKGYRMVGSPSITCDLNSQWTPKIPSCTADTGPKPPVPTPTTTIAITTTTTTTSAPNIKGPTGSGHRDWMLPTFLILAVIIFAAIIAIFLQKRSARRANTDKDAAKDGEDIKLS